LLAPEPVRLFFANRCILGGAERQTRGFAGGRIRVAGLRRRGRRGFTLNELMIVVALVGLLSTIALPNFVHARRAAQVRMCITNLRRLDDAKTQWALDFRKPETSVPTVADIVPYLRDNRMPVCPASGTYRLRRVSRPPICTRWPIGHTLNNANMDDDPMAD
jgi:prepilin-type N-terminal cleavage/methylation domain-containing protein